MRLLGAGILTLFLLLPCRGQGQLPFRNPDLPLEERVADLVGRLTLDEKAKQTLYNAPAIERLGIPAYNWWGEALHGVARAGKATVFPQAIGLAATWDSELMYRVATVISDEARAKYRGFLRRGWTEIYEGLSFWSPNINIFRDPRWGRGMETYGEDPYLTGRLAVEFVKGMQGNDPRYFKTIATPKHFAVHSGPEPLRHVFDALVDDRDLLETYLPAFRATVVEGHAQSIMCAYNRFRGDPCCGSSELIQRILRDRWGFDGYVVSDCWAIMDFYTFHKTSPDAPSAAAAALFAGTDLNCGVTYDSLAVAVRKGLIPEHRVDTAVARLFRARFRLGMFDPPERVPFASIPESVNDSKGHRAIALETTRKSIVLLKNEGGILPLRDDLRTVAVIGPNADDVELLLGNYNGTPADPVTPLEGIRRRLGKKGTVLYAQGCEVAEGTTTLEVIPESAIFTETGSSRVPGFKAEYFNNYSFQGTPYKTTIDKTIDFQWWEEPPVSGMKPDSFTVRWTGVLVPPSTGKYMLGGNALGRFKLYLDDSLLVDFTERHVARGEWKEVGFKAGEARKVMIEYWDRRPDASVQLQWSRSVPGLKKAALDVSKKADVVIMVMGLSPRLEGEEMPIEVPGFKGGDRTSLDLPSPQEELIREVTALGKPVVLVLLNGSAVSVNWAAAHVPAIVEAWYPGQAAGTALADVLFGDYNPAGRLPITFYKSVDQLPPFDDYRMKGRTYKYFTGEPLFPFGFGLSYTSFKYGNLKIPSTVRSGENAVVSVEVRNSGKKAGEEVVQLYIRDLKASAPVPIRSLVGFRRIFLKQGEKKTVTFTLEPRALSLIDGKFRRVVEPGEFEITVGGKQPGFTGLADAATTQTVSGRLNVTGKEFILDP
jgi:beta-glucosidase